MVGGRLILRNRSRYPDEEVEALVRFATERIDVKGTGIVVVVVDSRGRRSYSGTAYDYQDGGVPLWLDDIVRGVEPKRGRKRYPSRWGKLPHSRFVHVLRIGSPEHFPIRPFTRNGNRFDYRTWQEALVGIAAHEALHSQHAYDGAYRQKSGTRRPATFTDAATGRQVPFRRGGRVRVGSERIEPKAEAFEVATIKRWRESKDG